MNQAQRTVTDERGGLNRFYAEADDDEAHDVLAAPANVFDDFTPHRYHVEIERARAAQEHAATYAHTLEARVDELEAAAGQLAAVTAAVRDLRADAVTFAEGPRSRTVP